MAGRRPGEVVLIAVLAWIGAILQILSGVLELCDEARMVGAPCRSPVGMGPYR